MQHIGKFVRCFGNLDFGFKRVCELCQEFFEKLAEKDFEF